MTSKANKVKRLVLLDVHAILHRAYHALPEFTTSKGEPTGGLYGLSTMLLKIIDDLKPDYLIACYDLPKPTYRHEAYEGYKAGRAKADEALVSQIKRSYDIFKNLDIPIYHLEGFEADDMIGTIVHEMKGQKDLELVIASGDMDTLQLVEGDRVRVYTLKKGIKDTIIYNEEMVKERFGFGPKLLPDFKGLRGDPSDNIIGISGIGEKTASTLIQSFGSLEDIYKKLDKDKKAFKEVGITDRIVGLLEEGKEDAMFSKMLGTIRHDAPINFVIPEKTWPESVSPEKISDLWIELEFRTLTQRLKDILVKYGGQKGGAEKVAELKQEEKNKIEEWHKGVSEQEIKEVALMLWLVNSNMTNPQLEDLMNFAGRKSFAELRQELEKEIEDRGLKKVYEEIEKPLIPIVDRMNATGVLIDKEKLAELGKVYHVELEKKQKAIWDLAGGEFNISSPKQVGEILFVTLGLHAKGQKKTASGALSTKESELEKLRDAHPIIGLILEFRELDKLLSTYIDNIPKLLDKDNRLHTKFLSAGTTTGRMASQEPNLQNIPNKTDLGREIRKSFIADKGMKFLSFDYSQVELRIAAFLSEDPKLLEIFQQGKDIHTAVASAVFGVAPDKVDKEMRRRAKVINFGIIYGMGVNALRANLGTDRAEAQKFYDDYFANFKGLADYLENVRQFALEHGYTETLFGRRRYFEGLKSKLPFIKAAAERMAINAPIQGTEADIVKLAMIKIDEYLQKEKLTDKVKMVLQVHDELVYEVEEKLVEKVEKEIKKIMEGVVDLKLSHGVVCKAESAVGRDWGTMEKIK
jgi:DNA polymerase I